MKKITVCKLAQIMEDRGISQLELSAGANVTRHCIRSLQRNSSDLLHKPSIDRICDYLKIELWQLFERVDADL